MIERKGHLRREGSRVLSSRARTRARRSLQPLRASGSLEPSAVRTLSAAGRGYASGINAAEGRASAASRNRGFRSLASSRANAQDVYHPTVAIRTLRRPDTANPQPRG
jgi:hypothetical protein